MNALQTIKVNSEQLSPERYLKLTDREKSNISTVRIVPPIVGARGFGFIEVSYILPTYIYLRNEK